MEFSYRGFYDMTIDSTRQEMIVRGKIAVDITWSPRFSEALDDTGPVTESGQGRFRFRSVLPFVSGAIPATYIAEVKRAPAPSARQHTSGRPTTLRVRDHLEFINDPKGMGIGLFDIGPGDVGCVRGADMR